MRLMVLAAAALAGSAWCLPAISQETERFKLERTEDGYVRMDTASGALSICRERGDQLVCRMAAEERDAFEAGLEQLQDRVDALERRVAELEKRPAPVDVLPSQEDFDKTMDLMEKFFRRFMGIAKDLQKDSPPSRTLLGG
jgi:hypothetical protein